MTTESKWLLALLGLGALAALAFAGGGVDAVTNLVQSWLNSPNGQKWAQYLADTEDYYGIPRGLLSRIAYQESRFRGEFISGMKASSAGALGMMQLLPEYFDTVRRPVPFSESDTQDQIAQAAGYLVSLYHQFGNWRDAVGAYNDGPDNMKKILAGTKTMPSQTQDYIAEVFADVPVSA